MRVMGAFRELEKKNCDGLKSIHDFVGKLSHEEARRVLSHLRSFPGVFDYMGATKDPLGSPFRVVSGGPSICSDVLWVWRYHLEYFVENYRVGLPPEFLQRVQARNGVFAGDETAVQSNVKSIVDEYTKAVFQGTCRY